MNRRPPFIVLLPAEGSPREVLITIVVRIHLTASPLSFLIPVTFGCVFLSEEQTTVKKQEQNKPLRQNISA